MKRDYRELVGLQAAFDKVVPRYHLVHYYRWKRIPVVEQVSELTGYEMERKESIDAIIASLRQAYAPALLTVWKSDVVLRSAEYLQFEVGATPADLKLAGVWTPEP